MNTARQSDVPPSSDFFLEDIVRSVVRELTLKRAFVALGSASTAFASAASTAFAVNLRAFFLAPRAEVSSDSLEAPVLLKPVWHEAVRARLNDVPPSVREQVCEMLGSREWSSAFAVDEPAVATAENGALAIEWNKPGKKFAVHFELAPAESGWVYGSRVGDVVRFDSGSVEELDLSEMLARLAA
jgi:hypothetical protein